MQTLAFSLFVREKPSTTHDIHPLSLCIYLIEYSNCQSVRMHFPRSAFPFFVMQRPSPPSTSLTCAPFYPLFATTVSKSFPSTPVHALMTTTTTTMVWCCAAGGGEGGLSFALGFV